MNVTTDQQAFDYLKQLAADKGIDIAGAKVRRSSSRFCLGVEHGDYNGTELFGVGTDRFIWMAYKPNGTNTMRFFSGNFPNDGVVEFEIGNTPDPQSAEVYDTWARFPYGVDYILKREGYTLTQGIDAVLYGKHSRRRHEPQCVAGAEPDYFDAGCQRDRRGRRYEDC